MEHINFFSHERFSPRLIMFNEGYSMVHRFVIGCVVGDEKILVIDTGFGMTDELRRYIESVVGTDKPIICACTHGHADNVGSACLFDEAYCSLRDFENGEDPFNNELRLKALEDYCLDSKVAMAYCKENMLQDNRATFKDIKDGDVFDLGGVKIQAIAMPGHSSGSMAFYNAEEKYVFTGDAVSTDIRLIKLNSAGLLKYADTLRHFISIVGDDVTIYPAHLPLEMTINVAKSLVRACEEVAGGINTAHDMPGESIFKARQNNRSIRMHYADNCCIVYDRTKCGWDGNEPEYLNLYSHEKLSDRVYTVAVNYSTVHRIMLMVFVGDEKILVIDSCHGPDHRLREYIESFVGKDKPIIIANTHVGIDHAGGDILFDEMYIHPMDQLSIDRSLTFEARVGDFDPFSLYNEEVSQYVRANMCQTMTPEQKASIIDLEDGHIFDLGGITVKAIFAPGHTNGHTTFYCPEENICMTGDGMNVDTHLKALDREGFGRYVQMMDHFLSQVREDTVFYASHLNRPHKLRVPLNIRAACVDLYEGRTEGDPPGEAIQKHLSAFNNPDIKMHYHGNCCVVYNEAKLQGRAPTPRD